MVSKRLIIALSFYMMVAMSCKKKDSSEPEATPTPAATCTDGIQNQGELGIDCGGPCTACPATAAPCSDTNTDNEVTTATGSSYTFTGATTCGPFVGQYKVELSGSVGDVMVNFDAEPTVSATYLVVNYPIGLAANEVSLDIRVAYGVNMLSTMGDDLYVDVTNGVITIEFCNVLCKDDFSGNHYVTGRIVCP